MQTLPIEIIQLSAPFAAKFQKQTWQKAKTLLVGAILSPGKRTVTSAMRVMGLGNEVGYAKYHHVLNRASWSALELSKILLRLLLKHLGPSEGPLVFGLDETIERRWGRCIEGRGIYRDPVRSSRSHFVKASGLRWLSLMFLTKIPWAERIWALPVMTVLAPSERFYEKRKREPKSLLERAWQMVLQLRRWLPERPLVLVADSSYSALNFLARCQSLAEPVTVVTRLRMDAALYAPAPERTPTTMGRPRKKGKRLPTFNVHLHSPETEWLTVTVDWYGGGKRTVEIASDIALWYHSGKPAVAIRWVLIRDPEGKFEPQALLATDQNLLPSQILQWFILRWQLEVTFEESRAHLGIESQRQWSGKAITRTTPILFGLFSWVTLAAHLIHQHTPISARSDAWYQKPLPTFSDAIALVRRRLWNTEMPFSMSLCHSDIHKLSHPLFDRLLDTVCYSS